MIDTLNKQQQNESSNGHIKQAIDTVDEQSAHHTTNGMRQVIDTVNKIPMAKQATERHLR